MLTASATKERVPSLCKGGTGSTRDKIVSSNYTRPRTTAFTIAVRSAQIAPPVEYMINLINPPSSAGSKQRTHHKTHSPHLLP